MSKAKWTLDNAPELVGKVAIVTGANSGIGVDTAAGLAQKGATVIMACRDLQKARPVAAAIRQQWPGSRIEVMPLDLSNLDAVHAFAADFLRQYQRLDLLINNAGVMHPPYSKTAQGFEMQFGVNHLGHFALTGLLLDCLNRTPAARVVTVSSGSHRFGTIDFDDLNWEKRKYAPNAAYGQSKLANLLFTYELQHRLRAAGKGTLAVAAHPGYTSTNLQKHTPAIMFINPLFGQPAAMGALPTLYAAMASDVQGCDYIGPDGLFEMRGYPTKVNSNARSHDMAVAKRLWGVSEAATGVKYSV